MDYKEMTTMDRYDAGIAPGMSELAKDVFKRTQGKDTFFFKWSELVPVGVYPDWPLHRAFVYGFDEKDEPAEWFVTELNDLGVLAKRGAHGAD